MPDLSRTPLQAALLYDSTRIFLSGFSDWTALLEQVNTLLDGTVPQFRIVQTATTTRAALLSNDGLHISVSLHEDGLAAETFSGARIAPACQQSRPELLKTVRQHRHAVLIAVKSVPCPAPDAAGHPAPQPAGNAPEPDAAQRAERQTVARLAVLAACRLALPAALHWDQTDQLHSGPAYCDLAQTGVLDGARPPLSARPDSESESDHGTDSAPAPHRSDEDRLRAVFRPQKRGLFSRARPETRTAARTPHQRPDARARPVVKDPNRQDPDSVMNQLRILALGLVILAVLMLGGPMLVGQPGLPAMMTAQSQPAP